MQIKRVDYGFYNNEVIKRFDYLKKKKILNSYS